MLSVLDRTVCIRSDHTELCHECEAAQPEQFSVELTGDAESHSHGKGVLSSEDGGI